MFHGKSGQKSASGSGVALPISTDDVQISPALSPFGESLSVKLSSLDSVVAGKAAQSFVNDLSSSVSSLALDVATKADQSSVDALTTAVAAKASQSDLNSLTDAVAQKLDATAKPTKARRKLIRIAGKKYHEITASGTITRQSLLDLIKAQSASYSALTVDDIEVNVRCVSSGGGGAFGSTSGFGGFPGNVVTERRQLADLPTSIAVVVGAGAAPGTGGNYTSFGTLNVDSSVYAPPAHRGGNTDTEQSIFWFSTHTNVGARIGNQATVSGTTADAYAPNSPDGPGAGGTAQTTRTKAGGTASAANNSAKVAGPTVVGTDGGNATDANDDGWNSYGAGGSGNSSGVGGNGGFPGGGGGASSVASPAKGYGGNGCVRLQFFYFETVA